MVGSPKKQKLTPNKIMQFLTTISSNFPLRVDNDKKYSRQKPLIISDSDKKRLIKTSVDMGNRISDRAVTQDSLISYADLAYDEKAQIINENEELFQMTPELNKASEILISSIVAPDDFQYSKLSVMCDFKNVNIPEDTKNKIYELLTDYVEEKLTLSTKFPIYLKNILYISGADAIMTIPMTALDNMLSSSVKKESYHAQLEALLNKPLISNIRKTNGISIEKLAFSLNDSIESIKPNTSSDTKCELLKKLSTHFLDKENLVFTDNIFSAAYSRISNEAAIDNIGAFSQRLISIPKVNRKNLKGEPLNIRLPVESLSPIFVPGSPDDHIGYFCLLDDNGNPISINTYKDDNYTDPTNSHTLNNNNIQYVSNAFGKAAFDRQNGLFTRNNYNSISVIYQGILDAYLKDKTAQLGLNGVSIGNNESLFKYIFFRFLNQKQTRLLFIPKDYVTYMAFEYDNRTGAGVTITEKFKYLLKVRASILVSRALTQLNNSINRQKINITLGTDWHDDPDQLIQTAIEAHVLKNMFNFTSNPNMIQAQVLRNSYSVNLQGGEKNSTMYNVDTEPVEGKMVPVDTDLIDNVNDLLGQMLIVPPSIMNKTSEDEFATGVLSTNIIFQKNVRLFQTKSCNFLSTLAKNNCQNSIYIIREIRNLLFRKDADDKTNELDAIKDGNISIDNNEDDEINQILSSIRVTLPSPDMLPSRPQLERMQSIQETCSTLVDNCIPDELGANNDKLTNALPFIKSCVKASLLSRNAKSMGLQLDNLPFISSLDVTELIRQSDTLNTIATALLSSNKERSNDDTEDQFGGQGEYGGMGGMGGMSDMGGNEEGTPDEFDTGDEGAGEEGETEEGTAEEAGNESSESGSSGSETETSDENDLNI